LNLTERWRAGLIAALLYASSAHIFRYHVFEREIFTNTFVLIGCGFYLFLRTEKPQKYVLTGVIFATSFLIKLTGGLPALLISLFLLLKKQFAALLTFILTIGIVLFLATIYCYYNYGYPFCFQVWLFHFLKGSQFYLGRAQLLVKYTDLSLYFGILGFLFYRAQKNKTKWNEIKCLFLFYPFFFLFFSSTVWAHNLIDILPFGALLGGAYLSNFLETFSAFFKSPFTLRSVSVKKTVLSLVAIGLFIFLIPWQADEGGLTHYGFGTVPRAELVSLSQYIKTHTSADDTIFCPFPIIALSSKRKTLVRYWENAGVEAWMREQIEERGFFAAMKKAKSINFFQLIHTTSSYAYAIFRKNLEETNVPLLINVNPSRRIPTIGAQEIAIPFLQYYSGKKVLSEKYFEIYEFVRRKPLLPET
jgi:hypothetical protein